MLKVVLFVIIIFIGKNSFFAQNIQGVNFSYSYFDVFDIENTGGRQYVNLNYFKLISKHKFSFGLATALPHRYKLGSIFGINLIHNFSFLNIKKRFSIISCLDVNFYYHQYSFDIKYFSYSSNQIIEVSQKQV